jgi:glycosyltransferase involved in cell wall biosynthesis
MNGSDPKLSIVHVVLTSRFAGSERYAIELAAGQARAGHDVTLVMRRAAFQTRPDAPGHHVPADIRVVQVPDWLPAWHARRWLRSRCPDVVHAHLSAACRAAAGLAGIASVATLHIAYKPRQHAALDGLIAITPAQLATLPARFTGRSLHVDNWTNAQPAPASERQRLRRQLGIGEEVRLLGTLGRVEPSKGHDGLLEAFAAAGFDDSVHLAVVGAGSALDTLRRKAVRNVHFIGFTQEPQAWLAAMDGFVSAARTEPFGLVFLEAMVAGLPILATETEGARHLGGLFGAPLVPVDDVTGLTEGLRRFVAHGLARRTYPMERFRLDAQLPTIEAFYRQSIASAGHYVR